MKTQYYIPLAACALALASCSENSWNDKLDGFEEAVNQPITEVKAIEYTLTQDDYKAIASNSANKTLAESEGASAALASVGTAFCFNPTATPAKFVPAFLGSSAFPYFTLTDGSSVQLTYNVLTEAPEEVLAAPGATEVLVDEESYKALWGSDENYISAFAPSHPAARNLPGIVKQLIPDAETGQYAIVTYAETEQEPVFGSVGGDEPAAFELSSVLGNVSVGDEVTVNGVVTGICNYGYVLSDATGSVFVYYNNSTGFKPEDYPLYTQITLAGAVSSYNCGFQFAGADCEITKEGVAESYTYPTPVELTGAYLDQAINDRDASGARIPEAAVYGIMRGKANVSGNYLNIALGEGVTANGSVYAASDELKAAFTALDGQDVEITGYFIAIAGGKNINMVVNSLKGATTAAATFRAPAVEVPTVNKYALYTYNGSAWTVPADFVVVQPADYTAMGQTYGNLTEPALYLPGFMRQACPYAQPEDIRYVMFKLYAGGKTSWACQQYKYDGVNWTLFDNVVTETTQFVRADGKWMYDPNVTITLPSGRNQAFSAIYFQACVDWVYENICVPLGDTSIKSGKFYVTSYGNNEYYSGSSAYQNNVDLRPGSAREQYPAGWEGYTDDQIVKTMKDRFTHEVLPGALATIHADATPIDGIDVYYFVNFAAYTGSTATYTAKFKVTGPGQFEFVECDWD